MCSPQSKIVLSPRQMEALADPLRSDMVLALRAYGKASVAELSQRLAVDAKSLYYPLKKLIAAGLARRVGSQKGRRRTEAVYSLTAEHLEISRDAPLELRAKLVKTTIRSAEREFLAAQAANSCAGLQILRSQLWLVPEDRDAFLERVDQLVQEFAARSEVGRGELLHWTSLVAPSTTDNGPDGA